MFWHYQNAGESRIRILLLFYLKLCKNWWCSCKSFSWHCVYWEKSVLSVLLTLTLAEKQRFVSFPWWYVYFRSLILLVKGFKRENTHPLSFWKLVFIVAEKLQEQSGLQAEMPLLLRGGRASSDFPVAAACTRMRVLCILQFFLTVKSQL